MTIISTTVVKNPLERNEVALIVNKRVWSAVLGCNLKNDRMILVCFQGKPVNITVIQADVSTTDAEEAEADWLYEDLQLLEYQKWCRSHHRGLECKSRKSRDTWRNSQVWPVSKSSTKWSRTKVKSIVKRTCWSQQTPFSNNPRDNSTHGHH